MKYLTDLTQAYVKAILHYNPETGIWHWIVTDWGRIEGKFAGTTSDNGYTIITINCKKYRANRLAWLYMTGEWPEFEVNHENRIRNDDRWINLREANGTQNCYNYPVKVTNKLRVKGVHKTKNGRYKAQIQINKVKIYLGRFDTLEEAKDAHDSAANQQQGEFVHNSIVKGS